jgi:cytochrome c oxidase assembly protein subunit 15
VSTAPVHASDVVPSPDPAPAPPGGGTTPRVRSGWVRRLVWANLVAQIVIIGTGGAVRLTGSGLGCSTWPQCEPGEFTPQFHEATSAHTYIEFGNRMVTAVLLVISVALAVTVWRDRTQAAWYRRLAVVPLVGVAAQAGIGGITVLVKLHPAVVGVHMLVSLVLVAVSTVLVAHQRGAPERIILEPMGGRLVEALSAIAVLLVVLGIITTGAGPHGGDDEYATRYAIDPVLAAKLHAGAVWLFAALLLACLVILIRTPAVGRAAMRPWWALLGVTGLQGALGYIQYFTGLPEVIVGAHLLGTGVLVASLTWARSRVVPPALLTPLTLEDTPRVNLGRGF